jgi:Uma2 family endonuclease
MATAEQKKLYTEEEYLSLERKAEVKSEFFKGEIFAMAGATRNHNVITVNLISSLKVQLKGRGCRPYANDMRLHTPCTAFYTYPDIVVVCGKEEFLDGEFDTLLNPVFLVEVLSSSTADYDIGRKFMRYRSIQSLKEYWTISSYEYRLQKFLKSEVDESWVLSETINPNDVVRISSLDVLVSLAEVYEGVKF